MPISTKHDAFAPLVLTSIIITFISFTLTLATLLKVFWSTLGTFGAADTEIRDYLSSLKQGLLKERRHLRLARRRMRSARVSAGGGYETDDEDVGWGRRGDGKRSRRRGSAGKVGAGAGDSNTTLTAEQDALATMRTTISELITTFKDLEHPFLKPEFQCQSERQWSHSTSSHNLDKNNRSRSAYDVRFPSDYDSESPVARHMARSHRCGNEYARCTFSQRILWVRRKDRVERLHQALSRVEVRRTAHEVGEVLSVVSNIGREVEELRRGMDGVEGRLCRVVGVRRVQ